MRISVEDNVLTWFRLGGHEDPWLIDLDSFGPPGLYVGSYNLTYFVALGPGETRSFGYPRGTFRASVSDMEPIPEPGSLALCGWGLAMLLIRRSLVILVAPNGADLLPTRTRQSPGESPLRLPSARLRLRQGPLATGEQAQHSPDQGRRTRPALPS